MRWRRADARRHHLTERVLRSSDGQDVQEGPRVRPRVEDLGSGIEDQNEDDEDEQDDPDDHSGTKSTVVRHDRPATRGVHVYLAHLEPPRAKSVVPLASSVPRRVARSYARSVCGSAPSATRGSPPFPVPSASADSVMKSRASHYRSSSST